MMVTFSLPAAAVVVIKAQPRAATVTNVTKGRSAGDHFYTLSLVMTIICSVFGGFWGLMCTIPALFLAISAKTDAAQGRTSSAKTKGYIALGLNITAILSYLGILILVIAVGATSGVSSSGLYDYSYYDYYYYYYTSYYYYCNAYTGNR
eukprot:Em0004g1250a